jgi:reverse gyrase
MEPHISSKEKPPINDDANNDANNDATDYNNDDDNDKVISPLAHSFEGKKENEANRPTHHIEGQKLLEAIKKNLPELEERLKKAKGHWQGEDGFYRFYHGSLKVYFLQKETINIVKLINKVRLDAQLEHLNDQFAEIIYEGTTKTFDLEHNKNWGTHTRPILEAFFHAREMLTYMVKYGKSLDIAPNTLPSGWASVLYLFKLR